MQLRSRAGRSVVAAAVLSVGLSGGALTALAAPTAAAQADPVSAKQAAKAKKAKVRITHARTASWWNSQEKKAEFRAYGEAKAAGITVPSGYESGYANGTLTAKVGKRTVTGSFGLNTNAKGRIKPKKVYFDLDIAAKDRGKQVVLKRATLTFNSSTGASTSTTVRFNSTKARIKPGAYVAAYHFPKRKVLTLRGVQPAWNKKKIRKISQRQTKAAEKNRSIHGKGLPTVGGLSLVVQRAANKKGTKWKTLGRVRLNGKGQARFSKGVKKGGTYRVRFAGNPRFYKFDSWAAAYSGKPTKAGWPKATAKYVGPPQSGGGRVAEGADPLVAPQQAQQLR